MSNSSIEATSDNSVIYNKISTYPVLYLVAYILYAAPSLHLSYCIEQSVEISWNYLREIAQPITTLALLVLINNNNSTTTINNGARGGAVSCGTALQGRRSRVPLPIVSLEFFIDITLPAALRPLG